MATPAQVGKLCSKSPICRQYFIVGPCRMYPKVQVNEIESLKALVVVKFGFLQVMSEIKQNSSKNRFFKNSLQ